MNYDDYMPPQSSICNPSRPVCRFGRWVLIGVCGALSCVVIVVVVLRKRKKAKALAALDEDSDEDI